MKLTTPALGILFFLLSCSGQKKTNFSLTDSTSAPSSLPALHLPAGSTLQLSNRYVEKFTGGLTLPGATKAIELRRVDSWNRTYADLSCVLYYKSELYERQLDTNYTYVLLENGATTYHGSKGETLIELKLSSAQAPFVDRLVCRLGESPHQTMSNLSCFFSPLINVPPGTSNPPLICPAPTSFDAVVWGTIPQTAPVTPPSNEWYQCTVECVFTQNTKACGPYGELPCSFSSRDVNMRMDNDEYTLGGPDLATAEANSRHACLYETQEKTYYTGANCDGYSDIRAWSYSCSPKRVDNIHCRKL